MGMCAVSTKQAKIALAFVIVANVLILLVFVNFAIFLLGFECQQREIFHHLLVFWISYAHGLSDCIR